MPAHFEAGAQLVTEDAVAKSIPCGPDPSRHAEVIRKYVDAGYDEIFIAQVGDDQRGFLEFFSKNSGRFFPNTPQMPLVALTRGEFRPDVTACVLSRKIGGAAIKAGQGG